MIVFSAGAGRQLYRRVCSGWHGHTDPDRCIEPGASLAVISSRRAPFRVLRSPAESTVSTLRRSTRLVRGFFSATTLGSHTLHRDISWSSAAHPAAPRLAHCWPTHSMPGVLRSLVNQRLSQNAFGTNPVWHEGRSQCLKPALSFTATSTGPRHVDMVDRSGNALANVGGSFALGQPALSPDEKTIAVERVDPITQDQDLWLIDVARNIPSRFTSQGDNITFMPVWSPDGARIVFASARGTPPNLYQKASIGADGDELLLKSTSNNQPTDWSSDGQFIVYAGMDPTTQWDLWLMPMSSAERDRQPVPLLQTEFNEHLGRVSPDGRWIAYASDESGNNEVYVRPFRGPGPKRRISANGGSEPKWRGDGRELFYLAADGSVIAVGVRAGPSLEIGSPMPLFKVRIGPTRNFGYDVNYSVTRDGQRFVIRTLAEQSESISTTTVILNWRANLNQQ